MDYLEERRDLAAAFRWTARLNLHEGIANHFSLAVSPDGSKFLMNPYGKHWSLMKASDLLLLDTRTEPKGLGDVVDVTAWAIHGAIHRRVPHARCVMHLHPKHSTALACLEDPSLPPIDQNTMRFYNRVAVDPDYEGMGVGDEAERIASGLGNKHVMLMGHHGVLTAGSSVADAFDLMYYFERAAETYITALQTGRKIKVVSEAVAEKTAGQWENYGDFAQRHLRAIREVLDKECPDYLH